MAVITGASSGIGEATAEAFARAGIRVVLGARRLERLEGVAARIREAGGEARVVRTDVTQADQVARLVDEAATGFGRLDILVNNAGIGYFGPTAETSAEEAERLFAVNVLGTLHGIRAAVPAMRRQGGGHILTVASISGKRATPGAGVYAATKFAQVALSEALRLELREAGIRVSLICPVSTRTAFFDVAAERSPFRFAPTGPTYTPAEVAARIVRCLERPRPEVLIFRPTRLLVILNAISPRLVDGVLARIWKRIRPGL